ncbi:hypothetical protein DYH09_22145 [bacterium CPR1]|nr:hypothetical protein [bacterium CPR1]
MADDADVELDEPTLGNRSLSVALGVLVVLSLLVLGYYYQRPADSEAFVLASPSARPSPSPSRRELPTLPEPSGTIKVYVAGEVRKPGVVALPAGSRVEDALAKAGGMTPRADPLAINLASRIKDEQMIVVPARGQADASPVEVQPSIAPDQSEPQAQGPGPEPDPSETAAEPPAPPEPPASAPGPQSQTDWSQYINQKPSDSVARVSLNKGTRGELESVPGIGPSSAAAIVEYRKKQRFTSVDDLLKVPGIKEKKLEGIRPYVDL